MRDGKIVLCEVGCGPLSMTYSAQFFDRPDVYCILFEPNPRYVEELRAAIGDRPNVELHAVAIGDEPGTLELSDEGTSSSLIGVASPSVQHKGDIERKTFTVEVRRISDYDIGDIDHLRIDTEGNEWAALKHLVSRPEQIVVETYNDLATYINPHLFEIVGWAANRGYVRAAVHDSDFIYARKAEPQAAPYVYSPGAPAFLSMDDARAMVKHMLLVSYANAFMYKVQPDRFVDVLSRVFRFKTKVIDNLARYVQREAAKGHPVQEVLPQLDFFATVLAQFIDKNQGQPWRRLMPEPEPEPEPDTTEEREEVIVTREMALDAGDPQLEGQSIQW